MSRKSPLKEQTWYPYAVAACIAVTLYVVLTHLGPIWDGVSTFIGFFSTVIIGCIIAYLVNPLARMYANRVLPRVKNEKTRNITANVLAFITVLLFIGFVLGMVIPQLISSIGTFAGNLDTYMASLTALLNQYGITQLPFNLEEFVSSYESMLNRLANLLTANIDSVLSTAGVVGTVAAQWVIALLLSMYLLADKNRLKSGFLHLMEQLLPGERYEKTLTFFRRCDTILSRYIVYNLIDCMIVGLANALFMGILGLPYVGLVSIIVAVCNLVPTFGPIVGGILGAFILVLVKPWYAIAFLIFTIVLQTLDAYFIKPRLFGDSLGVPGLWILVGVLVGGAMFGIVGILVAIPAVAILDFLYHDYFMPWLETRGPKARFEEKQPVEAVVETRAEAAEETAQADAVTADAEVACSAEAEVTAQGEATPQE